MKKLLPVFLLAFIFMISSCNQDDVVVEPQSSAAEFSKKVPLAWSKLFLEVERFTPGYRPPVSARSMGYINLIAYESIVHGSNSKYKSFSGYFPGLNLNEPDLNQTYNWEACLNAAYEKALALYFPNAFSAQQFQMLELGNSLSAELEATTTPDIYLRSVEYGQYIAQTIYDWSAQDEWGHEGYLHNNDPAYTPPTGEGKWQPTFPDYSPALLPHWGKVRTFAARPTDLVPPPPAFSTDESSELYQQALEVYNMVNDIKAGQRDEDFWIAEFWSDDCPILTFTPAGRWLSIANQLIEIEQPNMLETVVILAKVGLALADSGTKCWQEKYRHNLLRPIDYIRLHMGDTDWNTVMCPDGSGGYYTPGFPAYPSGHATFGASAAIVLEQAFGTTYNFTDRCHEGRTEFRGEPRTFNSFREMAVENAYSRIPLGVHFIADANAGVDLGYLIGVRVINLPWQ